MIDTLKPYLNDGKFVEDVVADERQGYLSDADAPQRRARCACPDP